MRILVCGAGIAGPTLAFWLRKHGFQPTVVERAPRLRTGGHIIDFWGAGFEVAERMGLVAEILHRGYEFKEVREVDRHGRRVGGFAVGGFVRGISGGRFTSLPRSELAALIFGALGDGVETIFDDSIVEIDDLGPEVRVRFERTPPRTFDLVIGADGLHSVVRRLVFREDARVERYLGLKVAACTVAGYRPRDEGVYVTHTDVGEQVGRFAMRDDRTMLLFVFADPSPDVPEDLPTQKARLRERFSGAGWECPQMLDALDPADTLYMDRVSQIRMDRWTSGRVALVGDAAFCVSLLGGQGSALAMTAAYILAGELKRANGDHGAAFARYHERLGAFVAGKQQAAVKLTTFFAPRSRFGLFLRNQITTLLAIPSITRFAVGREFRDRITLPEY
ncbi:MAG TPA: FAD-binding domain [Gammaproteobacteria bacterium]|jgi:2-polyprenyl-6-methoxyphenol hydroxylase-like FAD-dependent oxidoreductase|nr:FAD-binding domain [Gammaproteobacteria bacterium]